MSGSMLIYLLIGVISGPVKATGPPHISQQALERLSQVFGIEELPKLIHHRSPPEYMLQLYNTVAFSDGITKRSNPYDASVVRGFPDRAARHQTQYQFNVSFVSEEEGVLAGEFRLYQTRPRAVDPREPLGRGQASNHVVELRLYQVLRPDWDLGSTRANTESIGLSLLDRRRISGHASGWHVFTVTDTIRQWVNDSDTNHGFLVTALLLDGTPVNGTQVRFAQRQEHHDSKQPVLVVFSGDRKYVSDIDSGVVSTGSTFDSSNGSTPRDISALRRQYIESLNEGHDRPTSHPFTRHRVYMTERQHELLRQASEHNTGNNRRTKRSARRQDRSRGKSRRGADYYRFPSRRKSKACQRSELYVDFDQIGWSGWIISPKGYNAYHCWGECPFPLGQYHRPTNHATVQSIVYTMRIDKTVQLPCCVPDKLFSISLLYFDDEENVILKQYDDMVAASCGCH